MTQVLTRHLGDDSEPPTTNPWAIVGWVFFSSVAIAGFWVRVLKSDLDPDSKGEKDQLLAALKGEREALLRQLNP